MMVEGTKRKKPPTFGHLPVNRAKKLKQAWVENTKIKSQWKAQKRREGLLQRKAEAPSNGDSPAHEEKPDVVDSEESGSSHSKDQDIDSGTHPERKRRVATNSSAGSGISLRELGKQAYSRNSLHTYKANPKRHDTKPSRGANPQRGSTMGRRGASSGDRGREKGQPNMKYRMTAMLEKIKRDFT